MGKAQRPPKELKLRSLEELENTIVQILEQPDEVYIDKYRSNVKYYLKKLDKHWVNVVVVNTTVKTAYLINQESYRKFREKRWLNLF